MKTEIKNRLLGTALAGILAAGVSMAKITPAFSADAAADGEKAAGHKDGCKGKEGCKGHKDGCKGKGKHAKGKKKDAAPADAPAADASGATK